jgi:hypothetical protein
MAACLSSFARFAPKVRKQFGHPMPNDRHKSRQVAGISKLPLPDFRQEKFSTLGPLWRVSS